MMKGRVTLAAKRYRAKGTRFAEKPQTNTEISKKVSTACAVAVAAVSIPIISMSLNADAATYAKTNADYLNVRAGAGLNYNVISVLKQNTEVNVLDTSNKDWIKIQSGNITGYCSADYVDVEEKKTPTYATTTDVLNMRRGAGTGYGVITVLDKNTKVTVLNTSNKNWYKVQYGNKTGYCSSQYLKMAATTSGTTGTTGTTVYAKTTDVLNMRKGMGTNYAVITVIDNNKQVKVLDRSNKNWYKVQYGSKVGYCSAQYLKITSAVASAHTTSTSTTKTTTAKTTTAKTPTSSTTNKTTTVKSTSSDGSIVLSRATASIQAGSSVKIHATKPSDMAVKWTSSNTGVATVNNGVVTGYKAGTATITVTNLKGNVKATCKVTVKAVSAGSLSLSHSSRASSVGKSIYIKGYGSGTWGTSDSSIATVSRGFIYLKKPGRVAITYTNSAGNRAICVVTANEAAPIRFAYASPNSATLNSNVNLVAITDKTRTNVKFVVNVNGKNVTVKANKKVTEGNTYVWTGTYKTTAAGTFSVKAYSCHNNVWSTCSDGKADLYVTSKTNAKAVGLSRLRASDELIKFIGEKEGFVSKITYDTLANNLPTIGHGYVVWSGDSYYDNLTKTEGYALLVKAVNEDSYTTAVNNMLINNGVKFNQQQFDALVSFSYNLGTGWTYSSDLRDILLRTNNLNNVNRNALINEMLAYHHAGGNCYYGLLYRRVDELEMFFYNDYVSDGRSNKHRFPDTYCLAF